MDPVHTKKLRGGTRTYGAAVRPRFEGRPHSFARVQARSLENTVIGRGQPQSLESCSFFCCSYGCISTSASLSVSGLGEVSCYLLPTSCISYFYILYLAYLSCINIHPILHHTHCYRSHWFIEVISQRRTYVPMSSASYSQDRVIPLTSQKPHPKPLQHRQPHPSQ